MYLIMQKSVAFLAKVSPFQATPCTWPLATNKPRKELSQAVNFPSTSHCNELGLRAVSKQVLLVVLLLSFRVNHPGFLLFGYPRASLLFFFGRLAIHAAANALDLGDKSILFWIVHLGRYSNVLRKFPSWLSG